MTAPRIVLIAGPTASGKSALALDVAERLGRAVIVNADSMQVYRDLRVLTARPSAADEALVPHLLTGTIDGSDAYSVARYAADARRVLTEAIKGGHHAIVAGGTGLYFKALLEGLSPIPEIDPEVRSKVRLEASQLGAARMYGLLQRRDPEMATRLAPTDTQRITRALEVVESTKRSLAEWQRMPGDPVLSSEQVAKFVLMPPRDDLMRRCDQRFEAMMSGGALAEVAALLARQLLPELPVMRALGVAPLSAHIGQQLSLDAAVTRAQTETRQFAKRQITWLKRQMISWQWLSAQEKERNTAQILSFIDS
jgi:tRNA dimethylallyltransferase